MAFNQLNPTILPLTNTPVDILGKFYELKVSMYGQQRATNGWHKIAHRNSFILIIYWTKQFYFERFNSNMIQYIFYLVHIIIT